MPIAIKSLLIVLLCLASLAAIALEQGQILQRAERLIIQHRLLTRAELNCSTLALDESKGSVATVTVREKHDERCGGAPEVAPRRFTMEMNLKTGAALWDNNDEMEMKPIPK